MAKLADVSRELWVRVVARDLVLDMHPGQRRGYDVLSAGRYLCLLKPRRSGKTEGVLRHEISRGLLAPGRRTAVLDEYPGYAYGTVLPIVESLARRYGVGYSANGNTHQITIVSPRGNSTIFCFGYREEKSIGKMRGKAFHLVLVDEAQKANDLDLARMAQADFGPCLHDHRGILVLAGTPGDVDRGLFYRVCDWHGAVLERNEVECPAEQVGRELVMAQQFDLVRGAMFENPAVAEQQREAVARLEAVDPEVHKRPWFRREYVGEWVSDASHAPILIGDHCLLHEWAPAQGDRYICGVDYGYCPDPTAWVVACCNPEAHGRLVVLESHERGEMEDDDVIGYARQLQDRYPGVRFVVDYGGGGHRHVIKVLREAGIPVSSCDKTENERDTIAEMRRDAAEGRLAFYNAEQPEAPNAHSMVQYLRGARWVQTRDGLTVGRPKHRMDALRYLHRASQHRSHRPTPPAPSARDRLIKQAQQAAMPHWRR